jgi:hypothetical protein
MDAPPTPDEQLTEAWRQAATDLGIEVAAPFAVSMGDRELLCIALVRCFGGRKGALLLPLEAMGDIFTNTEKARAANARLTELGYFCSLLGESYQHYDREHFVDTLNDWGWLGEPEAAPDWYTGRTWTA